MNNRVLDIVKGAIGYGGIPAANPVEVGPTGPRISSSYMRGDKSIVFKGWNPALRRQRDLVKQGWDKATARSYDMIHNSGWVHGMVDQATANTVGNGLRLSYKPLPSALGMTEEEASNWAKDVETRFNIYANDKEEFDIEGRRDFGAFQASAFKSWCATGEILYEMPWRKRINNMHGTKVRLLPPQRLSRKDDMMRNIHQGVRMNADGYPTGYLATRDDKLWGERDYLVNARDRYGRPNVVHIFEGHPGTYRGISPLVPVLHVARQFDQLSDATLMASIIQSVFAISVKADMPTEEALQGMLTPQEQAKLIQANMSPFDAWFEAQAGYYESQTFDTGINGRVAHLFPGMEMDFHTAKNPNEFYEPFSTLLLREMARCLGMTYESASGDYTGATYSSVRMGTGDIFHVTLYRRKNIIAPSCQPVFDGWLEEDIEAGRTRLPGGQARFYDNRAAICRALWKGSPKPQADDVKTAKAHEIWSRLGVMSDEMIANDLGVDIEDVYAERAREQKMRESLGLPDAMVANDGGLGDKLAGEDETKKGDE